MLLDSGFSVTLCVNIVVCRQAAAAAAYTERLMESADMSAPRGRSRSRSQPGTSTSRTSSADGYNMADLEGRLAAQRGRTLSPHARQVPDFHKLHETWHRRLATAKATNKRRVTVPQVCGGGGGRVGAGHGCSLHMSHFAAEFWQAFAEHCCAWPLHACNNSVLPNVAHSGEAIIGFQHTQHATSCAMHCGGHRAVIFTLQLVLALLSTGVPAERQHA